MKRKVLLVVVLCWGAIFLSSCVKKPPEKIEWASSLEDALKTAQDQDKYIIAEFWMDG
jgi:hypothetical protein